MTDDALHATPMASDAATLDGIFRLNAARRPDAVALIDPPDRARFTDGAPRRLAYAEAECAVAALTERFRILGLPEGCVVGLQLPNTAESAVAILAAMRAGLVPALLPLLWRKAEAVRGLGLVNARALIVCSRVAGFAHGELALHVAAETFSIRYVGAFGDHVPDGAVPLDDIWAGGADGRFAAARRAGTSDGVAAVTFDVTADGPIAISRTHAELLAGGLAAMLETALPRHGIVLSAMLPSSFAVLAATLVPWVLTGGTLALHQPFDVTVLSAQLAQHACDAVALPGPVVASLAEAGVLTGGATRIVALWRAPERQPASPPWLDAAPLIDVLAFGETGIVALKRAADGTPRAMLLGRLHAPSDAAEGAAAITTERTARGTLALGGPMVPAHAAMLAAEQVELPRSTESQAVDTGYPCRLDAATNRLLLTGGPPGIVSLGGYRFAIGELQDLVGRVAPDGALAALPDLLAGQRLAGLADDRAAMQRALAALGVTPLVSDAFRDRPGRAPAA